MRGNSLELKTEVAAGADSRQPAIDGDRPLVAADSKMPMPAADLEQLIRLSRSRASSYRVVQRSRILVALATGQSAREVARAQGVSRATVARWRARYLQCGFAGVLRDRAGRGRPPCAPATVVEPRALALAAAMRARGEPVSLRRIARGLGVSYASLQRLNAKRGWLNSDGR